MKRYYYQWPTLNKFDKLMSSNNKTVVVKLAKYIYFASQLRKLEHIYIYHTEHTARQIPTSTSNSRCLCQRVRFGG